MREAPPEHRGIEWGLGEPVCPTYLIAVVKIEFITCKSMFWCIWQAEMQNFILQNASTSEQHINEKRSPCSQPIIAGVAPNKINGGTCPRSPKFTPMSWIDYSRCCSAICSTQYIVFVSHLQTQRSPYTQYTQLEEDRRQLFVVVNCEKRFQYYILSHHQTGRSSRSHHADAGDLTVQNRDGFTITLPSVDRRRFEISCARHWCICCSNLKCGQTRQ